MDVSKVRNKLAEGGMEKTPAETQAIVTAFRYLSDNLPYETYLFYKSMTDEEVRSFLAEAGVVMSVPEAGALRDLLVRAGDVKFG